MIKQEDACEFIGQIIDIFEDFLESKGIDIPNADKEQSENPAIIYGMDYGALQSDLEQMMYNWGVLDCEEQPITMWLVSTVIDSCDSGCPNDVTSAYFTDYEKACSKFELMLDEAAVYGNGVSLYECCENADGLIEPHSTPIKKVNLNEIIRVEVVSPLSRDVFTRKAAEKLADFVKNMRDKYPQYTGTVLVDGAVASDAMMNRRLFELASYDAFNRNGRLTIRFVCACNEE